MKVGTDGVLIGAWANGGKRILDIGTGTGLIALMMAQRFDDAEIKAVDLDRDACCQARENVANSRFAGRVEVFETAIQQFHDAAGFDSIVSNPPFFQNSLKNPDTRRAAARHSDSLPFSVLFEKAVLLALRYGGIRLLLVRRVQRSHSHRVCVGVHCRRQPAWAFCRSPLRCAHNATQGAAPQLACLLAQGRGRDGAHGGGATRNKWSALRMVRCADS